MLKHLLIPVAFIMVLVPQAQSHALHSNPDHYTYIPPRYDISCKDARVLLKRDGYHVSKTIRCTGNYYMFMAHRSGRDMIVRVMNERGKRMIDARSGSKSYRWRMASR